MIPNIIKEAIKTIVPATMLSQYNDYMDNAIFNKIEKRKFYENNLLNMSELEIRHVFHNTDIHALLQEDTSLITKYFMENGPNLGVSPSGRRAIYCMIMALKPRNVLEIGTNIGASTIYIAAALKRLNEGGRLTTVDIEDVNHPETGPWKKAKMSKSPRDLAMDLGLYETIHFHVAYSKDFMRSTNEKFDLIFLDGEHSSSMVYEEVSIAMSLLEKNGTILLHDYYPHGKQLFPNNIPIKGPFRAMERIHRENSAITVLPLGILPSPIKQDKNLTSLAIVVKIESS
jgi:predicted O-methyltransferase YrrM